MAIVFYLDFETRSDVDLNKAGVEVYAESPHTRATMMAGAFDDEPIFGFLIDERGSPQCDAAMWERICAHVSSGRTVVAHNAPFELAIWRMLNRRSNYWPVLKPEQTECTMAMCHVMSLPGKLEKAALALRLPYEKDMEGHAIMLKLCKPRKPRKGERKDILHWHEDPADIARELEYCKRDVAPEREIYKTLPKLTDRERAYWLIDQRINNRGLAIDTQNAALCEAAAARAQDALADELFVMTAEYVKTPNSHKAFREWLAANGCPVPNLQRSTLDRLMDRADTLHPVLRRAIEIRQEASKSSTAKLKAMRVGSCADGRARGLMTYHGAGTGRPTGRRIGLNLPRTPEEFSVETAEEIFDWLAIPGGERAVAAQFGSVLDGISWSLRALIVSKAGKRLVVADYANIEGRVQAWLANEAWKLQAFRDYDTITGHDDKGKSIRKGPDLYILAVAKAFGVPIEHVTKDQRQEVGKVQELLLQFGGAHGAVLNMIKNGGRKYRWNGVRKGSSSDLAKLTAGIKAVTPASLWDDAMQLYWKGARETAEEILEARRIEAKFNLEVFGEEPDPFEPDLFDLAQECAKTNRHGLEPEAWAAIRVLVDGWRQGNPKIVAFWKALEKAAIEAVENPETPMSVGRITYCYSGDFLACKLPSGRKIYYPFPEVNYETKTYKRTNGEKYTYTTKKLLYEGYDSKKRWGLQYAYGGMLSENVTQATAACFQKDSHHRLDAMNYDIVLHVYDENVCELPGHEGSLEELCSIMAHKESWADGLPIAVAGWTGTRYRKG